MVESFGGDDGNDTNIAGYLELLNRRFTGAGSVEVEISNLTGRYRRRFRLGRWAGKDIPVLPGRKRKSKPEAR